MTHERIQVRPISGALGAEIHGVDLSNLDDQTFAEIRQAFRDHLVIFFRDQTMTPEQHKAFCLRFGTLDVDRFVMPAVSEHPELIVVAKNEGEKFAFGNAWHSDVTFYEKPPLGSVLYALEVPPYGGDTLFANTYLAYEALSSGMRAALSNLRAIHTAVGAYDLAALDRKFNDDRTIKVRRDREHEAQAEMSHPVIRTHPETGRKCLFVNSSYTKRFEGMSAEESLPLLRFLYAHITRPEFTCRFRWRKNSVAFWDNRCAQHYANNDYHGFRRVMHRVTIEGDRPV